MSKTKILIADDHPLFRSGVRKELESIKNFSVIAETGDGEEALKLIKETSPDVAVLDFEMPKLNGIEILQNLNKETNKTKVILLTMHHDKKIFFKALDAGVNAYVLKDDAVLDIVKAVEMVVDNQHFISEKLNEVLIEKAKITIADDKITNLINTLTQTEKRILSLVSELKSNEEIAEILFISKRTIENHKVNISDKLQLKGSRDLLKFAIKNKDYIEN